jgi:hypothetical protein
MPTKRYRPPSLSMTASPLVASMPSPVEVLEPVDDFKERGQRLLAWVEPEEAARRVREIELKSLLVDFKGK